MAKEFSIYLKRNLTECNLLVYAIPFYDRITVDGQLMIEAALNGYAMQKLASVQMRSGLSAHIDNIIKLCLEGLAMKAALGARAEFGTYDNIYLQNGPLMVLESKLKNLCYQLDFDARTAIGISALVFGAEIRHSLGGWHNNLWIDANVKNTLAWKFIAAKSAIETIQKATGTLIEMLYPAHEGAIMASWCFAASLKRYRLLSDVDNLTLSELDDMALGELDYVWLTD